MTPTRAVFTAAAAIAMACAAVTSAFAADPAPRTPTPKTPTEQLVQPEHATGRLFVKFRDEARVRLDAAGDVRSLSATDLGAVSRLIAHYRLDLERVWGAATDDELEALLRRAERHSGKAQPDLGGIYRIEVDPGVIDAAARRLNDLDLVEWVQYETAWKLGGAIGGKPARIVHPQDVELLIAEQRMPIREAAPAASLGILADAHRHLDLDAAVDLVLATLPSNDPEMQPQMLLGATGACCLADGTCLPEQSNAACLVAGGIYVGDGTTCASGTCGACCTPGGCLTVSSPQACNAAGGTFSEGVLCADLDNACVQGLCCIDGGCTAGVTEAACVSQGGVWLPGAECDDDTCESENCGDPATGNCWDPAGNGTAYCDNADCCNLVGNLDDTCIDENDPLGWDSICAAIANLLCDPHTPNPGGMAPYLGPDRCNSALPQGSCFTANDSLGGCDNKDCCNTVCGILPTCCLDVWGDGCVDLALNLCIDTVSNDPTAPPPDFVPLQSYLTAAATHADVFDAGQLALMGIPIDPVSGAPITGWNGVGYDLQQLGEYLVFDDFGADGIEGTGDAGEGNGWWDIGEPWDDTFGLDGVAGNGDPGEGDGIWNAPRGFWGFAEDLLVTGGVGTANGAWGRTVDVAVVGPSYIDDHYELVGRTDPNGDGSTADAWPGVISEPNQRLIQIPGLIDVETSTAILSVIAARETDTDGDSTNGRVGMTGIARECQPRFFPIASLNEGPREQTAWLRAIATLGPGDILTVAYQTGGNPGPTFNSAQLTWDLISLATDLGITVVIPAGDGCQLLDNTPDLGDSGAVMVGAGSPGTNTALGIPHRLLLSNYNQEVDLALGTTIHVRAWGTRVVAAAGGELYQVDALDGAGERLNLSYTQDFQGTLAASAQIAGLMANAQGFAEQIYDVPLPPGTLRAVFNAPGTPPGTPAPFLFGGFTGPCFLDTIPDEGPNWIGAWPAFGVGTAASITQGDPAGPPIFEDAPLVTDLVVVRGELISGNVLSIKGDDEAYLFVEGEYTDRNFRPSGPNGLGTPGAPGLAYPELNTLDYLISTDTVDLVVVALSDEPNPDGMTVTTNLRTPNTLQVLFVEGYDRFSNLWSYLDVQTILGPFGEGGDENGEETFVSEAPAARRFIEAGTQRIFVRLYFATFPGFNDQSGPDTATVLLDFVNVEVGTVFSEG